jgi:LPXTG-motif cell wall-anchored protein
MRRKLSAGVLLALAFLIPAAPAMAQAPAPVLNSACQTAEPKVYKDIRRLVTIDLDTATNVQVRILANQILAVALDESLTDLPGAVQDHLDGTTDDLRAFLKEGWLDTWTRDLRIAVGQTMTGAGLHVKTAAQKALDDGNIDAYLAYLNDGLYSARALDCASQPSPSQSASTPSVTPSASMSAVAIPASSAGVGASGGEGGGLAVTGAATGTAVAIGGALLLLGGAGYVIGRRRRSRFVA